jgi:electron transport complex protein RnfC
MIATNGMRGGLRLDAHRSLATARPIRIATPPGEVVLPVDQHAGAAALAVVSIGDRVLAGQPVARPAADISAWLHSPIAGRVVAIEPRSSPQAHGASPPLSIVIENDGTERAFEHRQSAAFDSLSPDALCDEIALGGIAGLGGAVFPTAVKLRQAARAHAVHLLLNGAECEPYISCDDMLMRERADRIVAGARILRHALGATACTIAVEDDMPQAYDALNRALASGNDGIRLVQVPARYPAGGERQLIASVLGVEVPTHGLPRDAGVVCQNVGTAAAVAAWIHDRRPLVNRIVTVTGGGVREPCNVEARIGTPIRALIADCGGYTPTHERLIMGGTMMGNALAADSLPVVKATNCIVAASHADLRPRGSEMPCIRCGNCSEVCPAILLPQQLHWYGMARDQSALERFGLIDCIECGCCDYVCPSQIPLTERFRTWKPAVADAIAARTRARTAREHFEDREVRLAHLDTEQEERLAAKRRALRNDK